MTEDEMIGWHHHQLNGHEPEQTPGDSEEQGSLACCSPWGPKERLNNKQQKKKTEIFSTNPIYRDWAVLRTEAD